jgi:hypothetical protein
MIDEMKNILITFENSLKHNTPNSQIRNVIAQINVILHQISSENSIVKEDDLLLHNLANSIESLRSSLSHIFAYDNEETIRDNRNQINVIKDKFQNADLNFRKISSRVMSHNNMINNHIKLMIEEAQKLIRDYDHISKNIENSEKTLKKAA